ncbi:hypothetical protein VNO77_07672 [Canavalia gladiata]|uniref:Uncharacterized protein n=1 Tax=Canavalia gladiata TaxID=3824 RepID=A0AAN9M9D0_CANGL
MTQGPTENSIIVTVLHSYGEPKVSDVAFCTETVPASSAICVKWGCDGQCFPVLSGYSVATTTRAYGGFLTIYTKICAQAMKDQKLWWQFEIELFNIDELYTNLQGVNGEEKA